MHPTESQQVRTLAPSGGRQLSRRAALQVGAAALGSTFAMAGELRLTSAQSTPVSDDGVTLSIPFYPYGQSISLDPHRAVNWGPLWVMLPNVWAGLLRFDENGAVVPDLASSVEPEEGGMVWVATIRSGATYVSGNPVTAESLIAGWKRALDPQQLAPMSSYMQLVEGFDAYVRGESEKLGFQARDESTVAIRLSEPYALFREDLATFVWAAVDTATLEGVSDADVPFAGASAGLWTFTAFDDDVEIRMSLNPATEAALPAAFDTVSWKFMTGPQAGELALDAYRSQEVAIADVTEPLRTVVEDNDALAEQAQTVPLSGSTMMIGMDFGQAPFDNPNIRRAVAASIDRERWASEVMGGAFTPADSLTPPVLGETANYSAPEPIPFDPEAAKAALADTGITEENMPQVTYFQAAGSPSEEMDQAAALLAMIQENSGLAIEHDTSLSEEQIEARRSDNGGVQFDIRWWWPLTNSPSGLADIGTPASPSMNGWFNWSAEVENADAADAATAFGETISEANTTLGAEERNQLYSEAEELLIQNAVYIPLGHGVQTYVQSPSLTGTRQGAFTGYAPVAFDEEVSYSPRETGTPVATPTD